MFKRHRFLILRRLSQLFILMSFVGLPWWSSWAKGSLSSSHWFSSVPLSDPFTVLQSLVAQHPISSSALVGAALITAFYAVVGGRVFCGWVCPINMVADAAQGLRRLLGLKKAQLLRINKYLRYVVLVASLAASAVSGVIIWELVNPIGFSFRGVLYGLWLGAALAVLAVFLFDFLLLSNGWCSYICPVGAFYGLIGKKSAVQVAATQRSACTQCGDCFRYCPEPHVISPALRGLKGHGIGIDHIDCLRCGRCIDVCDENVLSFSILKLGKYP